MARPISLYFHLPGSGVPPELLAEDHATLGGMRHLWRLLMAHCTPGPERMPISGDGLVASPTLQLPALQAIAQFEWFIAFIGSHPTLHRAPEAPVFLDSIVFFLRQRLASFDGHDLGGVLLTAQAGPVLNDDLPVIVQRLDAGWHALEAIVAAGRHYALERFFDCDRSHLSVTQGRYWVDRNGFGIHTLAHPYFRQLGLLYAKRNEHAPDAVSYQDSTAGVRPGPARASGEPPVLHDTATAQVAPVQDSRFDQEVWNGVNTFVRQGALWGLQDYGQLIHPCVFDSMEQEYHDDYALRTKGWQVRRAGRAGWLTPQGALDVACAWDAVVPCYAAGLYCVERDGRWGLVARGDRQWLPCEYLSVRPLALARHVAQPVFDDFHPGKDSEWPPELDVAATLARCKPAASNLYIEVRSASGTGLVDQANRVLVPFAYASLDAPQHGKFRDPRWMRLTAGDGRHGLWSMALKREVLACEHEWLDMVVGPDLADPLVATFADQRFRLWNGDGTAAFEGSFLWLCAWLDHYTAPGATCADKLSKELIAPAWIEGTPIRAARAEDGYPDGRLMRLQRGQPMRPEREILLEAWEAKGDRLSALRLSSSARYGFCEPKDDAAGRLWAARACGHEAAPATAVVGEQARDSYHLDQAATEFAQMLENGWWGERDAVLAREWALRAARQGGNDHAWLMAAKLLLDESAGPVDPVAALEAVRMIEPGSWTGNQAGLYLAQCLIDGLGIAPDWPAARQLLYRADSSRMRQAAPTLAGLLRKMAQQAAPGEAAALRSEADYFERKHADAPV